MKIANAQPDEGIVTSIIKHDEIGNRTSATNLLSNTYYANLLNQYTNMVTGGQSTNLVYDADGNLTDDGTWSYTWDGENRLVAMQSTDKWIMFKYDWMGRRIRKKVYNNTDGTWWLNYTRKFVYDLPGGQAGSWNLLAELDGNNDVVRSYMWGLDMSGTLQQAGGVGGLLGVDDVSQGFYFVAYDGNGNVMALVDADDGTVPAEYEYGPFGELIRVTGPMSDNPIRFSTKYHDTETGLVYYGYRYYWPEMGWWPSRDPIGERGFLQVFSLSRSIASELAAIEKSGDEVAEQKDELFRTHPLLNTVAEPNLYGFVRQDPVNLIDYLGLLSPGFGAGEVCVDSDCAGVDLSLLKYLPETNPPYTLLPMPAAGSCVGADAFYATGVYAKKIPDNGKLTVKCKCGAIDDFSYIKWPWWIGDTIDWEVGDPRPPGFPAPWPAP